MIKRVFTTINGQRHRIFSFVNSDGYRASAVFVASETPLHAESNIRKIISYRHSLLHNKPKTNTSENRRKLFNILGKSQYRAAIGL